MSSASFGEFLKKLREKEKLSQGQVGKQFNWKNGNFIAQWETDNSPVPLKYIPKLARLYKVPTLSIRKAAVHFEVLEATARIKKKWGLGPKPEKINE